MTDLDKPVERLNELPGVAAYVRRPAGIAALVGVFVLAGMLHIAAAFGAFAGAPGSDAILATFPFLDALLTSTQFAGVLTAVGAIFLIVALLDFVVAWALWDLRSWAWGFALALSIIELFVVPWGLLLGVVRIVYLSMREVRTTYDEDVANLRATVRSRRFT